MPLNILPNGNYGLQSDRITYIHLSAFDAGGQMVATPAGDVDTVAASGTFAASLHFTVDVMPATDENGNPVPDAGDPAVKCVPMVSESDAGNSGGNIALIITDSAGLAQTATKNFDIVRDLTAHSVGLDTSNTATVSQPAPTAPGP